MPEFFIGSFVFKNDLMEYLKPFLNDFIDKGLDTEFIDHGPIEPGFVRIFFESDTRKIPFIKQFNVRKIYIADYEIKNKLSIAIANIIDKIYTRKLIKNYILQKKLNLNPDDFEILVSDVQRGAKKDIGGIIPIWPSEDSLYEMILEYLSENNCLMIEGFVTFRLKECVKYLKRFTECSIDKVLIEAEHREFVRILKRFVDMQEEKNEEVHLIKQSEGRFFLLDKDGKILDDDYCEYLMSYSIETGTSFEDLLISALITALPSKVIVHMNIDESIMEIISGIFGDKIERCQGCSMIGCNQDYTNNITDEDRSIALVIDEKKQTATDFFVK